MANLKDINYGIGKYLEASDASDIPDIGTNRKNLDLLNFKVATNNAYALYNFKDGMIDAYQTQEGVDASASTNEKYITAGNYYEGVQDDSPTGGTTSSYGSTKVNTFLADGNFVVTSAGNVDMLIVAGGGGGGDQRGAWHQPRGGGGAGGMRVITGIAVTAQTYAIDVGAGGAGGSGTGGTGVPGENSVALGYTANGGGRGGNWSSPGAQSGGSGGGGSGPGGGAGGNSPSTSPSQGNPGGAGGTGGGGGSHDGGGGGGGGAGGPGGNYVNTPPAYPIGGAGGVGVSNDYRTGSGVFYAGGGGGGGFYTDPGPGGNGGGAPGCSSGTCPDATANTGGGGGGAGGHPSFNGSGGGSGIVVIKYADDEFESPANLTLVSNSRTAQAAPTEGRLMLYEQDVDAITLNTDLKGYVSRDGGTTYTQTTLVEDGFLNVVQGNDGYTKLLLHCDGVNGGTTFTDSSASAHTVSPIGNAQTDTAIKKLGTASCKLDGTGDWLSIPSSTDFAFGTDDFTIDFWININTIIADNRLFWFSNDTAERWENFAMEWTSGNTFYIQVAESGNWRTWSGSLTADTWHHLALVRSGNTFYLFKDGTSLGTQTDTGTIVAAPCRFGQQDDAATPLDGNLDEIRISKGIARWTSNFTPDTSPYDTNTRLLSGSVDISGQPSGTDMKYKVETLNTKNLRLHGASLLWA